MTDKVQAVIAQYWHIIVVVAFVVSGAVWQVSEIKADLREMRSIVEDNLRRLNEFASRGERYTLKDHYQYAEGQQERDAAQNARTSELDRRLTILEQRK